MTAIVTHIRNIQKHTNSDHLVTAEVLGYQVVTQEHLYSENQPVVFIPPDQVIPVNMAERMNIVNYLKSRTDINGEKVLVTTRIRLRGEPSFGILLPVTQENYDEGQDVSDDYGVYKFQPPIKQMFRGGGVHGLPEHVRFHRYNDIESLRNYPDMFGDGEQVFVTNKIHGTNSRIGYVRNENGEPELFVGSRRLVRDNDDALYSFPLKFVDKMLRHFMTFEEVNDATIYGEIFGKGVQDLEYGRSGLDYVAFDVKINGEYVSPGNFVGQCVSFDIPYAPVLYQGEYSFAKIKELADAPNEFGGDHMSEGVVVKSFDGKIHPKYGRRIGKYVSDAYLFRKNAERSDTTDV